MSQLVTPNLNFPARAGYCLEYVDRAFGIGSGEPTAWQAWLNTQFKHQDQNFPALEFPVFFSGFHGEGHVAIYTPNGICTSPPTVGQVGHVIYPSVDALAKAYGVTYVGWSEDITNVRVIEGETMPGNADNYTVQALSEAILGRTAQGDQNLLNNIGRPVNEVIDTIRTYPEAKARAARADAPQDYTPYTGPALYTKK